MEIIFHRSFKKDYAKLLRTIQEKFKDRRNLFSGNPYNPILNNHSVDAAYPGCRSFNVSGDYRVIFREREEIAEFVHIGTHAQLYG